MALLAPAGPVYQAGTLSGNPLATAGRRDDASALHAGGLRTGRRRRRGGRSAGVRGAGQGGRAARAPARREPLQHLLRRPRCDPRGGGLRDRARAAGADATRRSSTRMLDARRLTCRPVGVRGLVRLGRARRRAPWSGSPTPSPAPRAVRPKGSRGDRDHVVHSSGTARSTTPRASSTAGCRAITCPTSGGRWRTSWPSTLADRDITYVVSSPLERAQETAAAHRGGASPRDRHGRPAHRGREPLPGPAVRRRRRLAAAPPALAAAAQPVPAVVGRAIRSRPSAHARRRGVGQGPGPRPRGGLRQPPAPDLDAARRSRRAGGSGTTRASASAAWRR